MRIFYPAFDRGELLRILREGIGRLGSKLPLVRVVLFGSHARERYTVRSDVDLLVVYRGEPRPEAYALTRRELGIPRLEPHLYTEAEYEAVASTVGRMVRDGITLMESPGASGPPSPRM